MDTDNIVSVLDKGYVRLVDVMGSDLSIVNAARVSFSKESKELSKKDVHLIDFLIRENHMSPFRHACATFEFKAPLLVRNQHWKYVVGSDHTMDSWNESSRRYITIEPEFYVPSSEDWRLAPDNKKQGSGGPIGPWTGAVLTDELIR
jgi:thymidylate synthase (FAD)